MKLYSRISVLLLLSVFIFSNATAQVEEGYKISEDFKLKDTDVKNQYRSGTCWCFSGLSFLEAELLRMGKENIDFSEMFVVNRCYRDKADRYVRMHGNLNFAGGGAFHDVTYVLKNYGLVTEEAYPGMSYGTKNHVHGELDAVLKGYVEAVIKNKNREITPAWKNAFIGIIDSYLGNLPKSFTYKGKTYDPKAFTNDYLGLNADNYVEFSSFTHHPFYKPFILEVPDNWLWGSVYNLPLNEFEKVIDYSLKNGYTVAWAADISHKGFSHSNGLALIPETDIENLDGLERAKWEKLPAKDREKKMYSFNSIVKEKKITQELRQKSFDNYQTTDDHGMLLVGKAHDQNETEYYIVKNSWGTNSKYKGYFYASKAFVLMQATNIMVNKETIPKDIKKKLGF